MQRHPSPMSIALAAVLAAALCTLTLVGIGGGVDPIVGLAWVLTSAAYAGIPAGVYLLAALGYGRFIAARLFDVESQATVVPAIGLALMLTLSHALGVLGWLNPITAITVCAAGLALCVQSLRASGLARLRPAPGWVAIPAACVLLIAASNPPGSLWDSEFGGYDALSYHLQLPQEWLIAGQLAPLEHNVYSFLPGYMESAYLHIAALTAAPTSASPGEGYGLMAGDGWRVLSCQWLHAGMTLMAAWIIGGLTRQLARGAGIEPQRERLAGSVAAGLTLATPWVVVVGSLAYNEMALLALGAGALSTLLSTGTKAPLRAAVCGALVGVACGAKPTAMFMVTPVAGLLLGAVIPRRAWVSALAAAAIAGLVALSPWLIRNTLHGGNPIFPFATDVLGSAHWTAEQVERYARAHHFDGTLFDRLRLAVWTNPHADPAARAVERFRGTTNPQWGLFFPAVVIAGASLVLVQLRGWMRKDRQPTIVAVLLGGLIAQLLAWMFLTHIQSRFLLPCLLTGAPLVGIACAQLPWLRVSAWAAPLLVAGQVVATVWIWTTQLDGVPTRSMIAGVRLFKGEPFNAEVHAENPVAVTNHLAGHDLVYLLGGATPLYFSSPVLYHTTWDASPLGQLMREYPNDPWAWADALRRRGVVYVLADYAELTRLSQSGWYDPLVTPDVVMAWLDEVADPTAGWPSYGQMLYRLKEKP